ncbi:MAG: 2-amino-4-hydroxy-6-hydroxymethyldihydropteridine diphosphokinase [Chitinophagaceae bacterium]|nr:2-amino-4-hydroxy-6-hydroxymethyldihydropteridine diphosphokinase [Polaromonas sp.]
MATAFIALGANLGDTAAALNAAVAAIQSLPQTQLLAASSVYKTAPLGVNAAPVDGANNQNAPMGGDYLNAVVSVQTTWPALVLLRHLQRIERAAGRQRSYPNAPRTLDLDLLLYADVSVVSEALQLPHPRMLQRAFVLLPLAEIAPERVSAAQLLSVAHQAIARVGKLVV